MSMEIKYVLLLLFILFTYLLYSGYKKKNKTKKEIIEKIKELEKSLECLENIKEFENIHKELFLKIKDDFVNITKILEEYKRIMIDRTILNDKKEDIEIQKTKLNKILSSINGNWKKLRMVIPNRDAIATNILDTNIKYILREINKFVTLS